MESFCLERPENPKEEAKKITENLGEVKDRSLF